MPQVYVDQDENDSRDEEEDEFDCFYSYLLDREHNQSHKKENGNQRPSLSSSTATDSSAEENGIWKTLDDAKKRQEDIRNRLNKNNSKTTQRQERAPETGDSDDDYEEKKPDSDQDLRPEDVVRMVVRKASIVAATLPQSKSPIRPPTSSAHSGIPSHPSGTPSSRPTSSAGDSDEEVDSWEEDPTSPDSIYSNQQHSAVNGSISSKMEQAPDSCPAPSSKWKKSTANIHATNFAGTVTRVKASRLYSDREDTSESSEMTGITQFFDAVQAEDEILEMDEDEYREYRQKQKPKQSRLDMDEDEYREYRQEQEPKQSEAENLLTPSSSKNRKANVTEFPLVEPLPFIPPTFEKPEPESESEYDPEYEYQRLYVDSDDDGSFDKAYYDQLYGEYNDDRDPEERERERRQKELEARKRGEAESDDEESDYEEEEEEEERGLVGGLFKSVFSVGVSLGSTFFGGGKEEDGEEEEDDEGQDNSGHKRKSVISSPKSEGIFSSSAFGFMNKKAKNPPKQGAPPPSRELEIIKKCQQQFKVREKEAAEREARQKELDQENLRMRREEEKERARVKREVEKYRQAMIEMGKGDKLAKDLKKAKDEYEDRLAMEETLKQQQQKVEEMQERLHRVDEGKADEKQKKKKNNDSDDSSEYEAACCCVVS